MLLNYAGKHLDKMTLSYQIHKVPYWIGRYHGNPHDGFVGNMYTYSKPGYGVYHEPIFALTKRYLGIRAIDLSGKPWSSVEAQIRAKKPVWVIVNTRYRYLPMNTMTTWWTKRGPIKISMHEHSVLVTGYSRSDVYVNDPLTGKKNMKLNKNNFISGWKEFGSQAISFN